MLNTMEVKKDVYDALVESFGMDALNERMDEILISAIENRLEHFSLDILRFEGKYGIPFSEFEKRWDEGAIKDKHGYETESDFTDWEMLEMEKKELLSALFRLRAVNRL